ncbi:MAG TPA: ABC transporter ATP-binding protein [Acidimicrobiales bacterium]|nr:ABC transporter ATP-binding protein [Acidimicrobiales bacterium]
MENVPDGPAPVVVCDQLVIRYGDLVAVDGLSFRANPGEVVALLGPNGAGKTSTVECLEGYRPPSAGSVSVLGLDPGRDHAALVPRIGVMLQRGGVYPMLGPAQVLRLFAQYYDDAEDPDELVDLVGLGEVQRTPWRRLSGGEQQRLSLALALVGRPEVVFLDEPTAGVDPEGRVVVREIIAGLRRRGICVILTTHELAEAERLADRVLIIDHGRKLAEDTPAGLAAGTADGSIRFTTDPGIDTASLALAIGSRAAVDEESPGAYRLRPPTGTDNPAVVAALAAWLAERGLALGDLRTGHSLEEAYLTITGSGGTSAPVAEAVPGGSRARRSGRGGSR